MIDKNWLLTEAWYQWMKQVPKLGYNPPPGSICRRLIPFSQETGDNGAFCESNTAFTCYAPEWAIVNYMEREFGRHIYITIQNEYFGGIVGQRTGTKTRYTEHLFGRGIGSGRQFCFVQKSGSSIPTMPRPIRTGRRRASLRRRGMLFSSSEGVPLS